MSPILSLNLSHPNNNDPANSSLPPVASSASTTCFRVNPSVIRRSTFPSSGADPEDAAGGAEDVDAGAEDVDAGAEDVGAEDVGAGVSAGVAPNDVFPISDSLKKGRSTPTDPITSLFFGKSTQH